MKHCPNPGCHGLAKFRIVSEYEDTVQVCADCQAPLADGPAPAVPVSEREPDPDLKLVPVLNTRDESVLLIAESLLDEAGIPYLARGEQIQDLFGFGRLVAVNPITEPVEILVSEVDAEAARMLLEECET